MAALKTEATPDTLKKELSTFYSLRAVAHFHLGQYQQVHEDLTRGLEIDPNNLELLKNCAEMFLFENKYQDALPYYERALKLAPQNKDVKMRLARVYARLKKFDAAYELDTASEDIASIIFAEIFKFGGACVQCGACCRKMILCYKGKVIHTEEDFQKICQESPDFQRWLPFRDNSGQLRFNCSRLDKDNRCTDYENRQSLCRAYPNFMTTSLKSTCGFKRQTDLNYPLLKNVGLLNAIARQAMKMELYDEALKILKTAPPSAAPMAQVFNDALEEIKAQA